MAKEFALTLPQIDQFLDQFEVLKDTIINSPIESYPFPHIFIDKALNEFTLQKLWDDLPQDKDFDQIKNGGYILKNHSLQSYSWNAYDAFIRFTLINLLPKFKDWLEIKNNELIKLNMSCSRIRQYDSFLCFTDPARGVPPHIDGESSIISILTVLGYQNGSPAPVTNFFLKDSASEHYFPTTKYQPCRGSIFVWLNLANSYHGVIEKVYPKRLTHVASIESYEKYD